MKLKCADCETLECRDGKNCTNYDIKWLISEYNKPENEKLFQVASRVEAEHYFKKNRLEELIIFAKEMGFERLGIAFCIGLYQEARVLCQILERHFSIHSVCCKVCGIEKDDIGIPKIRNGKHEVMCNPIAQARVLNDCETDLNIICGLCIGHDIAFAEHSSAPVTTFIVKDRVLGHNPAVALYSNYWKKRLLSEGSETEG